MNIMSILIFRDLSYRCQRCRAVRGDFYPTARTAPAIVGAGQVTCGFVAAPESSFTRRPAIPINLYRIAKDQCCLHARRYASDAAGETRVSTLRFFPPVRLKIPMVHTLGLPNIKNN